MYDSVGGQECEKYCRDDTDIRHDVIPLQLLSLEEEDGNHRKDGERYDFLDDFQLEQRIWPSVFLEAHPVCRNHEAVFQKGQPP